MLNQVYHLKGNIRDKLNILKYQSNKIIRSDYFLANQLKIRFPS